MSTVTLAPSYATVTIVQTDTTVTISASTAVGLPQTRYRYTGSQFTNGVLVLPNDVTIRANATIALGGKILDTTEYTVTTTTLTDDTLTILAPLVADDVVILWT